jgi:hypothetical protein
MGVDPQDFVSKGEASQIEYLTLREEVIKRMEARTQYISFTLTLGGAFLGIGWGQSAVALLLFPPLAALLAAGWAQNEVRVSQLSTYIHEYLEPRIPGLGWERFSRQRDSQTRGTGWIVDALAVGGIFLLTQILAVLLASFRFTGDLVQWILLAVDIVSIAAVLMLVNHVRKQSTT